MDVLTLWAGTRLAHEAMMLEDAQQVLAANRRGTDRSTLWEEGAQVNPPEEMGIRIGDETHTHHHHPSPAAAAPAAVPGWLKGTLAAAGMLAAGGTGALLPALFSRETPPAAIAPAEPPPPIDAVDTDTHFELRLAD